MKSKTRVVDTSTAGIKEQMLQKNVEAKMDEVRGEWLGQLRSDQFFVVIRLDIEVVKARITVSALAGGFGEKVVVVSSEIPGLSNVSKRCEFCDALLSLCNIESLIFSLRCNDAQRKWRRSWPASRARLATRREPKPSSRERCPSRSSSLPRTR